MIQNKPQLGETAVKQIIPSSTMYSKEEKAMTANQINWQQAKIAQEQADIAARRQREERRANLEKEKAAKREQVLKYGDFAYEGAERRTEGWRAGDDPWALLGSFGEIFRKVMPDVADNLGKLFGGKH